MLPTSDSWIKSAWQIGKIRGIPILLHWSLPIPLLIILPLQLVRFGWPYGAISILNIPTMFGIVLLHELGHCAAAKAFGCEIKNILLTGIGGLASISECDNPKKRLIITLAGPAVNVYLLFLGIFCLGIPETKWILQIQHNPFGAWETIYTQAFIINLTLLVFNLMPIYPMDGGRLLKDLSQIILGEKAAAFLTLTAAMAIGIPTALLIASKGAIPAGMVLSAMSFFCLLESYTILTKKPCNPNPPSNLPPNPPEKPSVPPSSPEL